MAKLLDAAVAAGYEVYACYCPLEPTVRVEHKTGEDEGITNDVGILYGREPCVLVFVSNETDVPAFEQVIRTVSLHYTRV